MSHPPPEPGRLLMKLRMKEYKKMLVPLDNEKRWFEKVKEREGGGAV